MSVHIFESSEANWKFQKLKLLKLLTDQQKQVLGLRIVLSKLIWGIFNIQVQSERENNFM